MKIKECREEEDKHKIYTGSAPNRAYMQSPSNLRFLRFLSIEASFMMMNQVDSSSFDDDKDDDKKSKRMISR